MIVLTGKINSICDRLKMLIALFGDVTLAELTEKGGIKTCLHHSKLG